jgi:coproporphyrinogen III oxidase
MSQSMAAQMADTVHAAQDAICAPLAALDQDFVEQSWDRPGGGGGRSRLIQGGRVFDKAGVNVSVVHGTLSPEAARAMTSRHEVPDLDDRRFYATGLSLVLHPVNPFAPTVHANFRYFELADGALWWFGGGIDLTPSYLFEDDVRHFHGTLRDLCARHPAADYPAYKAWADRYFHLPHRGEARGVGGIFFDDLNQGTPNALHGFVSDGLDTFLPSYLPILERRMHTPYTADHSRWQGLRRGRYVEFNLVYDRGTLFGLRTGARIDSVLMSLPLQARWESGHDVVPDSPEDHMQRVLKEPRTWA